MIIKVINSRSRDKSHFDRLGRYILNAKNNNDALFKRTAEYVIDVKGVGEKVGWSRVTNCQSDTPAIAIAEVLATQSMNKRTRADKTYHLVVSLPHWEILTKEKAVDIEDTICAGLGFADHQRISAVHQDTEHSHLHIAINKIHPETFRCVEPYYPYYKLDALAKELEIKHGLHHDNRIAKAKSFAKVGEMEKQQQEESFLRWIHERLSDRLNERLQNVRSWQDIHSLLAEYGARIKPRGAGLAISTLDGAIGIKASSLDRRLSFKSLTDRFGEFEPPNVQVKQLVEYSKDSRKRLGASALYSDYQRLQQENRDERSKAMSDLRLSHKERRANLTTRYTQRRASVKSSKEMDNRTKRSAYQQLSQEKLNELAALKRRYDGSRGSVQEKYQTLTWTEFLVIRAEQGDSEALAILRRRKNYRRQIRNALLTAETFEEARDIVKPYFKPTVLKNGNVIYRSKDGGVVCDEATAIGVQEVTEAATFLALSLALERFQGKAIVVEGSNEFKLQIVRLAAMHARSIRFADPVLERDVRRHARAQELVLQQSTVGANDTKRHVERDADRGNTAC